MKKLSLTIITISMCFFSFGQNHVYDKNGSSKTFSSEDIDLVFTESSIKIPSKEFAPALLALIPTVVDLAFKTTTKILENNVKKFSAEYSKQKSYLKAGDGLVPDFSFVRKVTFGNAAESDALKISFKAHPVAKLDGAFVYDVSSIDLAYSAAKANKASKVFDYTIELKLTAKSEEKAEVIEMSPIVISAVGFGTKSFDELKHRSDIISLPKGSVVTAVSVKIVETNPAKVRAEKVVASWNDYKDDAKTIINNFLPKAEDSGDKESGNDDNAGSDEGTNGTTGARPVPR